MRLFAFAALALVACSAPAETALESAARVESCAAEHWEKLGVVSGLPDAEAAGDGVLAPAVLESEGALHLWYTRKIGSRHVLMHATSRDDGATFAAPDVTTGFGDDRLGVYPNVWRENGKYELLFGSGSFKRATSDDGVSWVLAPAPVLSASFEQGRFDALSVLYPSRVATDEGVVLFLSGYDGQRIRIGRAVPREGGAFAVDPPRPVIDLGDAAAFDNAAVAQAHVQYASGTYRMWYGGYDTSMSNPGPYRIGSASSKDGITWEKQGVAVELGASGTDAWSTRDPAVLPRARSSMMFYVGLGDDGRYRLHRAKAACR